ncbi:MAG: diversity-generating retroelement protein Avd [Candidatus Hydrogenedentes bacterium]|mgnify:CR=1 FL=1|nr:diversity-generating retroelement protein Avd [Candidatus Hydrogenedentota bacterium]
MTESLSIIQHVYDLILWYVPRVNKFPRDHKFMIGDRIQKTLYDLLERLIRARYSKDCAALLESLNAEIDVLRYQTRLTVDLRLLDQRRYEHVSGLINEIGRELGGWRRYVQRKGGATS